ncbi:MAG TPA: 2-dehydropantoate 2-reductase [Xanthobacteraceae bacterium]|nr:2-dehydropantoate 2-reductase [Xanthobacteraceae bacterium]
MRILVVGAGAIGGYFGGRLRQAGRDATFLVRSRRAAQLATAGLIIKSPLGDVDLPAPATVTAESLRERFDLILLSCKAYDLAAAADSFAPAVGANTAILPLLNGMAHIDVLSKRFGAGAVLGGQCVISVTLDADGRVLHLNDTHLLSFGELNGAKSPRAVAIAAAMAGARFESRLSTAILQEMWEKWVLIATMAGITCLMRAAVGDIVAAGGGDLALALLDECAAIAAAYGFAPRQDIALRNRAMLTAPGSTFAASMLRDIERGASIEGDHIVGDLIRRGEAKGIDLPLLRIAYAHLKSYEARRKREQPPAA